MALRPILAFAVRVVGDGSDRVVSIDTASGPFGINAPATLLNPSQLPPNFSLATNVPLSVINVISANGSGVTFEYVGTVLTITYNEGQAPPDNVEDTLTGSFTFAG